MKRAPLASLLLIASASLACQACCIFDDCRTSVTETDLWSHADAGLRLSCDESEREPNDTVPLANAAPTTTCQQTRLSGVLGGDDVDVTHVRADRCTKAGARPRLHRVAPEGVRMCLFVQCAVGSTGLSGCLAGRPMHMANGLIGCCTDDRYVPPRDGGTGAAGGDGRAERPDDAELEMNCSNVKPDVDAYIVVDGEHDQCVPYELTFTL